MTKLHFKDLTQITCPFGMLADATKERLKACEEVELFGGYGWYDKPYPSFFPYAVYRAKPKPQRLVTWVQWDDLDEPLCCEDRHEANQYLNNYGGYIYRIERDGDGSNPTIELVETGGGDETGV